MICPKCGSQNVDVQAFQENIGSKTVQHTKFSYKQKGHGCLWWLFIGWWWWMVDIFIWIFAFIPRLIIKLFQKKKYVGDATSVAKTDNKIKYKTMCICKNCGNTWQV